MGRGLLDQAAQKVLGEIEFLRADAEFFAVGGGQTLDGEQAACVVVGVVLAGAGVEFGMDIVEAVLRLIFLKQSASIEQYLNRCIWRPNLPPTDKLTWIRIPA
ncbi:hypothetical protein PMA3_11395 [Pseudomonas silesiensis]|uniref:Uncharacterized protein n=1 Tax=Pseudomonas silesiensis TaxID=1853130 RepID=A0A191YS53_9PSED|nr:hypothetical protein PMA3_11395 [Pseudomonas silesiensis]